ncbi:hypothetical protein LVJ94_10975 [Pendulispora rubella]|uniref:Glycoside hydrolase family 3 N-terminal domain-containing protein n=1 Tax=Pendulispora rubella TaxID=2741070 RepID=A0ABZ2LCV5_9BACT
MTSRWIALSLAALLATACSSSGPTASSEAWSAELEALTPAQLAGQRIVYSYPGLTPPASLLDRIRAGEAAGVIFFGENISTPSQIKGVIDQLVAAQKQSPIAAPLLLMTDQEGGIVRRLPGEPVMSAKDVGASSNAATLATKTGTDAGNNLRGVGMNVNLAPVIDVYRREGDFLDRYERSYSKDSAVVSNLGKRFITAEQQVGVASTAKHFPGLGSASTNQNTDEGPVTLNASLSTLRNVDESPYPAAIAAGVKLVMPSWAVYPALDRNRPAGLSSTVLQQELRTRLGFTGVIVSDALEAGALDAYGTAGQRGVLAAKAGIDLLLCSARDVGQGQSAASALTTALQNGELDATSFNAAVQRVTDLRNDLQ